MEIARVVEYIQLIWCCYNVLLHNIIISKYLLIQKDEQIRFSFFTMKLQNARIYLPVYLMIRANLRKFLLP